MPRALSLRSVLLDRTFRSLRHRNYRLYFFGQIVSFTGSWMQSAALMWLVYDRTHDPKWPPLMLVASVGPTLLLGPVGGALADRLPKRQLVMATQLVFLLNAILLASMVAADHWSPWLLFALQVWGGMVLAIDLPARLAFVPELIPKADLINAVGLNSLTFNAARAVGPALAGLLFVVADALGPILPRWPAVTLGAVACFTVNALSYLAVLVALRRIDRGTGTAHNPATAGTFWDGFRFLAARPPLATLIVLTGILSIFGWPALTMLPAYTKVVLGNGAKTYSLLVSALGSGALVAALTAATFSTPARRGTLLIIGTLCGTLGLATLTAADTFAPAAVACGLLGFGLILFLSTAQSTFQLRTPDVLRGRVMALWAMTLSASSLPGHLTAGLVARDHPLPWVLGVMTLGVAVAATGMIALVAVGGLDRPNEIRS